MIPNYQHQVQPRIKMSVHTFGFLISLILCSFDVLNSSKPTTTPVKFRSSVVYSFANVTATSKGNHLSQLTIATAPDGQLHYIQSDDGKRQEGIWTGPIPQTPTIDLETETGGLISNSTTTIDNKNSHLTYLSQEIDSSIKDYINRAMGLAAF